MDKLPMNKDKSEYRPSEIESKWQKYWEENRTFTPDLKNAQNPYYTLMMFPYPSAEGLHVGNMYAFTGADVHGRYMRMKGKDVFEPIGLDGFGIHSENYAIKVGRHPKEQAKISQKNFYRQLRATGNAYDWTRTVETYDPDYYRWTQWIFVQMFKKGLAYRKYAQVNWCPSDKTVLADEQVIDGRCERDGALVEKRDLEQWFFKITEYADALLSGLNHIDWPEKIKIAQTQWIGRSEGARIKFPIQNNHKYIILHGHKGSPETDFHPWLKKELEKLGAKVDLPHLPGGLNPNIEEQVEFLLKNYDFDENTILVTHSLGGVAAMKLLPRLKHKIAKLVMVAPPLRTEFIDKRRPELEKASDWKFDFEKIRTKANELVVLADTKDDVVPLEQPRQIARELGAKLVEVEAPVTHFNSTEAPQVLNGTVDYIEVFTTRADTLFGATFMVLSPEYPLVASIKDKKVQDYVQAAKKKTEKERIEEGKEKTGVFSGLYAINPVNDEKMPVWIADYVLMTYGTGAIMAVPAHDSRDFEFAQRFGLKIIRVVVGTDGDSSDITKIEQVQEEEGRMVNSDFLNGMDIHEATIKIMDYMEEKGYGKRELTYHLRDWLISRQRYWGPPIPMIFCSTCEKNRQGEREDMPGWWTAPEDELPVLLPNVEDWRPEGSGTSPLANHPEFYETRCRSCNNPAERETDVSDTFLDSSWYYLRYLSIGNKKKETNSSKSIKKDHPLEIGSIGNLKFDEPYDIHTVRKWCPVAIYIGGAEHSVLHLLYVRFIAMVLHDLNSPLALPFQEPFPRFYAHGLLISQGAKMSKSRGNVIVPDDYIKKFGADTVRLYLMFLGPFDHGGDFRDTGIEGMHRFVRRVWKLFTKQLTIDNLQLTIERQRMMHKTIKAVTEDIEQFSYNTAIAKMMEYYNYLSKIQNPLSKIETETFLKLLAPFAPHLTEELFEKLKLGAGTIHKSEWPSHDERYLVEDQVKVVVQVNGKRRGEITVASSDVGKKEDVEVLARKEVEKHIKGKTVKNVIHVPGKITNFVI